MFEAFQCNFAHDAQRHQGSAPAGEIPAIPGVREFFASFGGMSFRNGLYRAVDAGDLGAWQKRIGLAFPQFAGRVICFGYDWLGRTFAIDLKREEAHQPAVLMFEPGTGKALQIPANIETFHDLGLMQFGEAVLAISFYEKWIASGGQSPAFMQCLGYKKPLFLGGKDLVENLELSDLDVYWHIMGQLIVKTRGLPTGTPVRASIG
jgi:hypothetical protein